ncbi:MAG: S4 domain-containing protein [Candidatus Sedimenticola endophacoides]
MSEPGQPTGLRLDKWLWAARFFKTRQLAVEAINVGKVHINGQRAKPEREVRPGTRLRIHKGSLEWEITVEKIPKQRRPASEAITFYSESEQSRDRREAIMAEEKLLRAAAPRTPESRPNKKQRRMIHRFTRGEE